MATGSATFLNTGGRTFQEVQGNNLPLSNGAMAVVGDFNGDGKDDVAINLPGDTTISIWYSKGDGTFYLATVVDPGQFTRSFFASGADVVSLVTSDLNKNGKSDLIIGNFLLDFAPPNVNVMFHQ
jgi:VCBS repeat protein